MTTRFQWSTNLLGRLTLWGHRGGKWVCGINDRRRKTITWVTVTKKQRWLPICKRRKKILQLHSGRGVLSHNCAKKRFVMTKLNTAIKCILQLVMALWYKMGGSGFDSKQGPWKFSSDLFLLSAFSSPGVHSSNNRNEYRGIFLGVRGGRRVELTTRPSA
jgi:hypothetical protein